MKKLLPTTLLGVATLAALGLIGMSTPSVAAAADEDAKREDDTTSIVLAADDDDDDDTGDDTTGDETIGTLTGQSANTNDNTASNFTGVSRDRDLSRGDNTRDWTRDGGDLTRDWSANQTNDQSLNDTRSRR